MTEKQETENKRTDLLTILDSVTEAVQRADFIEYAVAIDPERESVGTSDGQTTIVPTGMMSYTFRVRIRDPKLLESRK